jgi:hypothetical protein
MRGVIVQTLAILHCSDWRKDELFVVGSSARAMSSSSDKNKQGESQLTAEHIVSASPVRVDGDDSSGDGARVRTRLSSLKSDMTPSWQNPRCCHWHRLMLVRFARIT